MRRRKLFLGIISFLFLYSCGNKEILYEVSKAVSQKQDYKELIPDRDFALSRKALIDSGKLSFIDKSSDTLYVLEMVDGESNILLAKVFNSDEGVEYAFKDKKLNLKEHRAFSGKIESLVRTGDTIEIRKQDNILDTIHPKPRVYVSRIVFNNKDYHVSTYTFKHFN